jgi:hypothetical protein
MNSTIEDIRLIASAARLGSYAATRGQDTNPFDDASENTPRRELLRKAWHFGWMGSHEMGDRFYNLEQLLQIKD